MPLLSIKKPNSNDYWPVHDLREVNKWVENIHPTVPNLYTLLSILPLEKTVYTVLNLKDVFFSLPLVPARQSLFTFEWTDPEDGFNGQLMWTHLTQEFKNSPTVFDEAFHEDLVKYQQSHPNISLLQYMDDLQE